MEDQLRKALLNPVPGEMSEDLYEYHHYLRNWGVRDLSRVRCWILSWNTYVGTSTNCSTIRCTGTARNLFYEQRREKSAPWCTAGFGLEHDKGLHGEGPLQQITAPLQKTKIPLEIQKLSPATDQGHNLAFHWYTETHVAMHPFRDRLDEIRHSLAQHEPRRTSVPNTAESECQ